MKRGQYKEALKNTKMLLARERNFEALMLKAGIYSKMNETNKAARILKSITTGQFGDLERSTAAHLLGAIG